MEGLRPCVPLVRLSHVPSQDQDRWAQTCSRRLARGKDPLKPPRRGREQALPDLWEEAVRNSGVESEHLPPGEDGDTAMSDV